MDSILIYDESSKAYKNQQFSMQRENGTTPNGNNLAGKWVLRDRLDNVLGWDSDRQALADLFDLELCH